MRYTVLDEQGIIVNIVVWDGIIAWTPPPGHTVRPWQQGDRIAEALT